LPLIGARMVVLRSASCDSRRLADDWSTWCDAASRLAMAISRWVCACSSASCETSWTFWARRSRARTNERSAWSRLARDCAACACADASIACASSTRAWYCVGSMRTTTWPRWTSSPSFTGRSTMRPVMSDETSTFRFG
jgi:hypothetical protein